MNLKNISFRQAKYLFSMMRITGTLASTLPIYLAIGMIERAAHWTTLDSGPEALYVHLVMYASIFCASVTFNFTFGQYERRWFRAMGWKRWFAEDLR
jgi:hypothetical protein